MVRLSQSAGTLRMLTTSVRLTIRQTTFVFKLLCITLAKIFTGKRLQTYAYKIRTLTFKGDEECSAHRSFSGVTFPNLAEIELGCSTEYNTRRNLLPYLQPCLRSFKLSGGALDDAFLSEFLVSGALAYNEP